MTLLQKLSKIAATKPLNRQVEKAALKCSHRYDFLKESGFHFSCNIAYVTFPSEIF